MRASAVSVTVVPLAALAAILALFFHPPWTALRVAGLVVMVVFSILLTIARVQLGDAFSVTPQARSLVRRGIYSKVRHPVYVFSASAIAGVVLYIGRPWLLLVLLVLVPMQVIRARQEERVLTAKFGEGYLEYKRSTWF